MISGLERMPQEHLPRPPLLSRCTSNILFRNRTMLTVDHLKHDLAFWKGRVSYKFFLFPQYTHAKISCRIQPVGSQNTTGINLAGHSWNLWRGPNANWEVLSFVSANGDITDFNADLNDFFRK